MGYGRCAVLLVGAGLCSSAAADARLTTALEFGYRVDSLDWNIAGNSEGQSPNILSELEWSNLVIPQGRVTMAVNRDQVYLFGSLAYGQVVLGDNQDSDFNSDNRQLEFSRSNNQAGGEVTDMGVGLAYRIPIESRSASKNYVVPMAGFSLNRQSLTMTEGNQTVSSAGTPPLGPFPGLNSSYDARWRGGWVGVGLISDYLAKGLRLEFDVAYHRVNFWAEADWNLRSEFKHPGSFYHHANGNGITAAFNVVSRLGKKTDLLLGVDYGTWQTDPGVDTVYLASGSISQTRLNEVNWNSATINLGLAQRF